MEGGKSPQCLLLFPQTISTPPYPLLLGSLSQAPTLPCLPFLSHRPRLSTVIR